MNLKHLYALCRQSVSAWVDDYAPSMGAAISYYTIFSLTPLLVIVIAIAGALFGREAAQGRIVEQISGLVGREGATAVEAMLRSVSEPDKGLIAGLISAVVLLVGATTVFAELQSALDRIWHVPEREKPSGLWAVLRARLLSFGLILGLAFLLMVSLVVSAGLSAFGNWFGGLLPGWEVLLHALNMLISLGIVTLLFAMIYKLMPTARIAWRDVWIGALVTAVLFELGQAGHRAVPGQERRQRVLCRGGLAGAAGGVGVLRGADLPAGGRVHQGLRQLAGLDVGHEGGPGHEGRGG